MPPVHRTLPTRLLHATLMLAVLWQLFGSNFVERPRNGQPGNGFYTAHEIVGLVTLALVTLFWLWTAVRRRETPLAALLPWLLPTRVKAVFADLAAHWRALREWRLPGADEESPLASAVHGLGLFVALAMAASGAWLYTQSIPGGLAMDLHKALANLMWAYVIGHAGLALVHQFAGHPVLQRMFSRAQEPVAP